MAYTVEVETNRRGTQSQTIGKFEDSEWGALWDAVNVGPTDWERWRAALMEYRWTPVAPQFPAISNLAVIDEDMVTFKGKSLSQLHAECKKLAAAEQPPEAHGILSMLLQASTIAIKARGHVIVHPFSG